MTRMDSRDVLTRPAEPPDVVLRYGDDADHLIDVWLPAQPLAGPEPHPLLLLIHGGFWRQEWDRMHVRPLANALRQEGFAVAAMEYRRTGDSGGWPTTFDDTRTVVDTLTGLLESVAPGQAATGLTVIGHSAGGHLAMWAATRCAGVTAAVGLAPVADLYAAYNRNLDAGAVRDLLGGSPDEHPDRYRAADVASALPAGTPITVIHGDQDLQVPVEMSRDLAAAGSGVEYIELAGIEHFGLIDPRSAAYPVVLETVRRVTSSD
jgi:acetyl esterase/lipase